MRSGLIDKISARIDQLAFITLILLGITVVAILLYSVGNPRQVIVEISKDQNAIISYASNTFYLFTISIVIQLLFFFVGTLYVRRLTIFAKLALILPFITGTIAPAIGFYTFLASQIGPFQTAWFIGDPVGARTLIALVDAWQWTGVLLFFAFACTERIPAAHFEQATLEGISRLQQWLLIVWPAVSRTLAIYVAFKIFDWARKFEIIQNLFGKGGPDEAVKTFAMHAATRFYDHGMESYASGLALIQLLFLLGFVIISIRFSPALLRLARRWPLNSTSGESRLEYSFFGQH
jgi:ABC-type sugar transport system permease subunit